MSADQQFVRVIYIIRRPDNPADDSKVILQAKKIIQDVFKDYIVPFNSGAYTWYMYENSGLRVRYDKHDLNSIRIDVNLREEPETSENNDLVNALAILGTPLASAGECHEKLINSNRGKIVKCYVSFEIVAPRS